LACYLNCFKQYVICQSHTRHKSCRYVSMLILHPDNPTSGFVSVTIWCFWVFARRQLLKIHRRFGKYCLSLHQGSRQACGLNECIGRGMWEISFSEWWAHQSDGWRVTFFNGREGRGTWRGNTLEYGGRVHFSCYSCLLPRSESQKLLFAPCNMRRGENLNSCICQFLNVYNLRND
jgi:hypothetical protein